MAKLPCPPELWGAFSALLDEALALDVTDRPRWLAKLGAQHAAVRPWVARALACDPGTLEVDFLRAPMLEDAADDASEFSIGQRVGPYVLQQRLGSGGMGEVWLAARGDGTLNRQVALKLPHLHLMANVVRRRFERERDILAGLSHPHIAQLYDAGVDGSQHPYLAMEWVDGVSIIEHCHTTRLPLEGRLELFSQILDAVGYAHARLVAHRDLKPSNILVTREGRIKLLDFGIAKLVQGDSDSEATQLTRIGSCIATPGYAAPEQLTGAPITVAVDLYALGVILHELVTGQRPQRWNPRLADQRQDVGRPSARIEVGYAAEVGGLTARDLRRALAGDLDAIIIKALEPDPNRRYRTAEAFVQDLELRRQHRPISARHISAATVAAKFVHRHRVGVTMSVGLLFVLIAGSAGIAWQAVRAEREARRATAIKDFLVGVFRASDPRIAADKPRGEITARELLDISSQQIEASFRQQPETEIELLGVTADIYRELDETKRSTALYARETELAKRHLGPEDPRAIDGLLGQAFNADADGDEARAMSMLAAADPLLHEAGLDKSPLRARWLLIRGEVLMDDPKSSADAEAALTSAATLFTAVAPRDAALPVALTDLGGVTLERSEFAQSAAYFRHAIQIAENDPLAQGDLLLAYAGLALALKHVGDFTGAAGAFEKSADVAAHTYGLDSHNYWATASDWARFQYDRGERQPALEKFNRLIELIPLERTGFRNASDALEGARVLRKFGHCLAVDGQGARAVEILSRAEDWLMQSAPNAVDAADFDLDLGIAYQAAGETSKAHQAFTDALQKLESKRAPPSQLALAHELFGRSLLFNGDLDAASKEFDSALHLADGHPIGPAILARAGLAWIAVQHSDAAAASRMSQTAYEDLANIEGSFDVRIESYVAQVRARSLLLQGKLDTALELATRAENAIGAEYVAQSSTASAARALVAEIMRRGNSAQTARK